MTAVDPELSLETSPAVLAEVHAAAFPSPWSSRDFADLLGQDGVFALGDADGFILVRVVADEAEILTLAVRPAARRRGLARALTVAASHAAASRGAARLFLEVAEDNLAAQGLYGGLAFGVIGRRRGYYAGQDGRRIDAVIMGLDLPAAPDAGAQALQG